jgi:hypothetical protein
MYTLCKQTVTIYNSYTEGSETRYHRTVINGVFLERGRKWNESASGLSALTDFLLIIPRNAERKKFVPFNDFWALADKSGSFTLRQGDKVYEGVGAEVRSPEDWASLLPQNTDGLVVVRAVRPQNGPDGKLAHIEAN